MEQYHFPNAVTGYADATRRTIGCLVLAAGLALGWSSESVAQSDKLKIVFDRVVDDGQVCWDVGFEYGESGDTGLTSFRTWTVYECLRGGTTNRSCSKISAATDTGCKIISFGGGTLCPSISSYYSSPKKKRLCSPTSNTRWYDVRTTGPGDTTPVSQQGFDNPSAPGAFFYTAPSSVPAEPLTSLTWNAQDANALGRGTLVTYNLQYKIGSGDWQDARQSQLTLSSRTYDDKVHWLEPGALCYRARAVTQVETVTFQGAWGEYCVGHTSRDQAVPAAPVVTVSSAVIQDGVTGIPNPKLEWNKPSDSQFLFGYQIRRRPMGGADSDWVVVAPKFQSSLSSVEYEVPDSALPPTGQTYEYSVRGYSQGGGYPSAPVQLEKVSGPRGTRTTSRPTPRLNDVMDNSFSFYIDRNSDVLSAGIEDRFTFWFSNDNRNGVRLYYGSDDRGLAFDLGAGQAGRWIDAGDYAACVDVIFCWIRPSADWRYYPPDDRPSRWLGVTSGPNSTDGFAKWGGYSFYVPPTVTEWHTIERGFARIPHTLDEVPVWLEHADLEQATHRTLRIRPVPAAPTNFRVTLPDTTTAQLSWELATDDTVSLRAQYRVMPPGEGENDRWETICCNLVPQIRQIPHTLPTVASGQVVEYRVQALYDYIVNRYSDVVVVDPNATSDKVTRQTQRFRNIDQNLIYPFQVGAEVNQNLPRVPGSQTELTYRVAGLTGVGLSFDAEAHQLTGTAAAGIAEATLRVTGPGTDDFVGFEVQVGNPPGKVLGLTAQGGAGHIALTWQAPTDVGSGPITGYRIERSPDGTPGSWEVLEADTGTTARAYVHTGLRRDTTVHYQVAAINVAGIRFISDPASATAMRGRPSEPRNLTARAEYEQVVLNWESPSDLGGGFSVDDYNVNYSLTGTDGWSIWSGFDTGNTYNTHTVALGMPRGTTVYYRVRAVLHSSGTVYGAWSEVVSVDTYADNVPSAPRNLEVDAGDDYVDLEWEAPAVDGGSAVTSYLLEESESGEDGPWNAWSYEPDGADTDTSSRSGIPSGQRLHFRISARNANGLGPPSTVASGRITVATPSAPSAVTATAGREGVLLSWTAADDAVHLGVDGYRIDRLAPGAADSDWRAAWVHHSGTTRTWFFDDSSDLSAILPVKYRVAALSSAHGASSYSSEASTTLDLTHPGPPENVSITQTAAGVRLRWAAPTEVGTGGTIAGYRVERLRQGETAWAALGAAATNTAALQFTGRTARSQRSEAVPAALDFGVGIASTSTTEAQFTDRTAADGDVVTYRVFTVNSVMETVNSESTVVNKASTPVEARAIVVDLPLLRAPVGVRATAGLLRNQLAWTAVTTDELSGLTGYRIEHAPGYDTAPWQLLAEVDGADTVSYNHDFPGHGVVTYYRIAVRTQDASLRGAFSLPIGVLSADVEGMVDLNQLDGFTANDVLIMYYAFQFPELVGDGTAGSGFSSFRTDLLTPLKGSDSAVDTPEELLAAARTLASEHGDTVIDLNGSGGLDGNDALIMYYALEFRDLLGDGNTGGTVNFRSTFLKPLAGTAGTTDDALREMLRTVGALGGN